jgi:DNA integrity scanning protein DisA with diadenylate cyclase activity
VLLELVNKIEFLRDAKNHFKPTCLCILSDDLDLAIGAKKLGLGSITLTSNERIKSIETKRFKVRLTKRTALKLAEINTVKEEVMQLYMVGLINDRDRVLVFSEGDSGIVLMCLDMKNERALRILKNACEEKTSPRVVGEAIRIAREISHEGGAGALLVIGDTEEVLRMSSQLILNPFKGYSKEKISVFDEKMREIIKEFAKLDGALILRENGSVETAGRYIHARSHKNLPQGLGGRHFAAATITRESEALAVTCSATGAVRVFKGGRIVLTLEE